jgi:hypothetical protein
MRRPTSMATAKYTERRVDELGGGRELESPAASYIHTTTSSAHVAR